MTEFSSLKLAEWQQFQKIDIEFGDRLTILTGANGSGKTTLLNLLARHAGWQQPVLAAPRLIERTIKIFSRLFRGRDMSFEPKIGSIGYKTGIEADIVLNNTNTVTVNLNLQNQQPVSCFFLPSHRPVFRYQQLPHIPLAKKKTQTAFQETDSAYKQAHSGHGGQPVSFHIKNTIIGWVIQGYGVKSTSHSVMPGDPELIRHFEGFEETLRKVLPPSLGFECLEVREMELILSCNGGEDEFLLETASGGVTALIDLAWQIYMFSSEGEGDFTVILDEVENHLHPTMQRQVLPDFLAAFPKAKFIVSTHSPLIVSSVKDARVYALCYNNSRKVVSEELDFGEKAKSANEILREVLGLDATLPIWVQAELKQLVDKYASLSAEDIDFQSLRSDLGKVGLADLLPDALSKVLEKKQ